MGTELKFKDGDKVQANFRVKEPFSEARGTVVATPSCETLGDYLVRLTKPHGNVRVLNFSENELKRWKPN